MMGVAQEILKDQPIEWQIADAQDLPFEDNSIDLIVCAFGYMFLPDKVKGFASAYRVLKPGGKLLFTTWDKLELNGASLIQRSIAGKFLGDDAPPSFYTAFSMNNYDEIRQWLQSAGFDNIDIESVEKTARADSAKEMAASLTQGGTIYDAIVKRNPDWVPQIQSAIEKELTEKFGAAPMLSPMRAVVVTATKDR
jgi:ubiquinone/menaquinone biosynthesis C-methylase UbiE